MNWRAMKLARVFLLFMAVTVFVTAAPTNAPVFQIRLVLDSQSVDSDRMIFRHPTNSMPGRVVRDEVIHLMKTPLIDQTALKSAAVKTQPITGQAEIEFVLTTEGQGQFAKLTCENINSRVAVIVDGNVMFVPVIISEVTNGLVEIYGNFNELEATNLVMRVNGATSR